VAKRGRTLLFYFAGKFTEVFLEQQEERKKAEQERLALLSANPFDPDVQKRIAEEIR